MPAPMSARILPMTTAGTQHFIERTYRESGAFQWAREALINSIEAGATRIEFGIEWQAVQSKGAYRRVIADDGCGMSATQLVEFFNTFGGGGKPIGGPHENFGVGVKTTTLPWNREGMVVVSWVDGEASMIRVQHDSETGEYGLRLEEVDDENGDVSLDEVYEPYDDEDDGGDWSSIRPEWLEDHGTVIVLLGNDPIADTVLGDPSRNESDIKGLSSYLNRRLWEIPTGVSITVDELRTEDRAQWPTSEPQAHGPQPKVGVDRRTNLRTLQGARYFIEYPVSGFKSGGLESSGTVSLSDGTAVDWYLWAGQRPAVQSYAAIAGYIGALYRNELYDVTSHHSTYRSFGVSEGSIRSRLWIVLRPPLLGDDKHGVYPRTDRNSLLLRGGPHAGGPLPINQWGNEFADLMPKEILAAINAARAGSTGTIQDDSWRQRLADRFGSRWRIPRLRKRKAGPLTVDPTQEGTQVKRRKVRRKKRRNGVTHGGTGGHLGGLNTGSRPGSEAAVRASVGGGIPQYRTVTASEVGPGMLAAWQPNDPTHPEGVVLLNIEHPVLRTEIEHWQAQYADHYADDIAKDVVAVYGEIAVAKVAHSEYLKGVIPSKTVDDELRSEPALTMALLGLMAEEAVIAPRIGGRYKGRKPAA